MNKQLIAIVAAAAALAAPLAQAQDSGSWIVRGRALHLDSANKDTTGLGLSINNKWFPEVDISYFFTPNLAAELVLTYPQKHTLHSSVLNADAGTLKHLPPTLSLQYHVTGLQGFRPYVGAGINYTRFSSVKLLSPYGVDKNSFGLAFGAGVDVPLQGGWLLNVDVKKAHIHADVTASGKDAGTLKVDPVLFSVGVGYRF
jgi:outer membrane protein